MGAREIHVAGLIRDHHRGFGPESGDALDPLSSPWRYVAELTGPEHVAISLDYDPTSDTGTEAMAGGNTHLWPPNCGYDRSVGRPDVRRLLEVADELGLIGFSRAEIVPVLGGNFRRVAEQV